MPLPFTGAGQLLNRQAALVIDDCATTPSSPLIPIELGHVTPGNQISRAGTGFGQDESGAVHHADRALESRWLKGLDRCREFRRASSRQTQLLLSLHHTVHQPNLVGGEFVDGLHGISR